MLVVLATIVNSLNSNLMLDYYIIVFQQNSTASNFKGSNLLNVYGKGEGSAIVEKKGSRYQIWMAINMSR